MPNVPRLSDGRTGPFPPERRQVRGQSARARNWLDVWASGVRSEGGEQDSVTIPDARGNEATTARQTTHLPARGLQPFREGVDVSTHVRASAARTAPFSCRAAWSGSMSRETRMAAPVHCSALILFDGLP